MSEIGDWIDRELKIRDWSVAELHRRTKEVARNTGASKGVSDQALYSIVAGRVARPDEFTIRLVSIALGKDPAELLAIAGYSPVSVTHPEGTRGPLPPELEFIWRVYRALPESQHGIANAALLQTGRMLELLLQRSAEGEQEPEPRPSVPPNPA